MYIGTVNFLYSELAQAHPKIFKIYTVFPQNLTAVRFKALFGTVTIQEQLDFEGRFNNYFPIYTSYLNNSNECTTAHEGQYVIWIRHCKISEPVQTSSLHALHWDSCHLAKCHEEAYKHWELH